VEVVTISAATCLPVLCLTSSRHDWLHNAFLPLQNIQLC